MMNLPSIIAVTLLIVLGVCIGQDDVSFTEEPLSPYLVVIDGGSTGSRLHIFQFIHDKESASYQCERRGSSRANVPMSSFAPEEDELLDPEVVAAHMLPPFEFAADVIPPEYHNTTIVKYQATAGMRLLTEQQQEAVYDALYLGLMQSESFVFKGIERNDIATLSGSLEGYYGAVAANFLSGIIEANLQVVRKDDDLNNQQTHPIGALDMGGSSTQIVYLTEQVDNGSHSCANSPPDSTGSSGDDPESYGDEEFPQTCPSDLVDQPMLQGDQFFSTSYLAYGVDQFRERLWDTLISGRLAQDHSDSCDTKVILYPCGFKGHQITWNDFTLIGTGDAGECTKQVQRLLPHPEEAIDNHHEHSGRVVGGIEHPTVRGRFFAMSLYFFTLDSLRVLSSHDDLDTAWPQPSINELTDALEGLCSRAWQGDLEEIQHNAHQFTRAEVLPHRCFESCYMVSLLRDGFGFHPESRDITFTFLVDGSEVEWSLGMSLELYSLKASSKNMSVHMDATCHDQNVTSQQMEAALPEVQASTFGLVQGSD
ncbi:Nucleoside-diphosphatase mig-23 [Seminavis robusta]|uniref:Nucleoside-diphosphatase mig-23 n=1 Tax=Seminavis robusta TaxID=568900 RepID=A0A9N8EHC9_9STRA|nr:Nucleoside-diphosphatase mig-23 [Seminavis robusta]|eukprot:Sro1100_g241270.1 Nucleoside-diphosphatase mig-23 (538) ;mRNA; r:15966-17709